MRSLIIINGYPNGEKFYTQANRIAQALENEGVETEVVKNGEVCAWMEENGTVNASAFQRYDFIVYLDKDKYLGQMLEKAGLRLFNSAKAVEYCDDKLLTYLTLEQSGVRLIKSIPAPLCYTPNAEANPRFLQNVAKQLGFPLVAKKSYGSFGMGVELIHGMPELEKIEQAWLHQPHFYQAYIAENCGKDIRVIVIGGKAVGCMERRAQNGEFRSNIELGGVGAAIEPEPSYIAAAEQAAKALGLDYCGVDLLETAQGPMICEVNSNAFFEGFEKALGLDVAKLYAAYIVQEMAKSKI